jgi:hypothetical protein
VLPVLVVFGLLALSLFALLRRRSAGFRIVGGRFVASPVSWWAAAQVGSQIALGGAIAGGALRALERDSSKWTYVYAEAMFAMIGLTSLVSLLFVVALVRGANRVELHPWGLRVVYIYGGHDVPWEAVSRGPGGPQSWSRSKVDIGRPDLVRSSGLALRNPRRVWLAQPVAVPQGLLVDAVNRYLGHPEHRAAIGTVDEHEQLVRAYVFDRGNQATEAL